MSQTYDQRLRKAAMAYELSLLAEDDEMGGAPEEVENTSFDDVAMILLLFFMVTSLTIYFPLEKQSEADQKRRVPVMDANTMMAYPPDGVEHRLLVKSDEGGDVYLEWQRLGETADVTVDGTVYFSGADMPDDIAVFKAGVHKLVGRAEESPPEGPFRVDVVVVVAHDLPYGKMQKVWYG